MKKNFLSLVTKDLCDLARKNDFDRIASLLLINDILVFLEFLGEMYRGNGWLTNQVGEYLTLVDKKNPEQVVFIIRARLSRKKLTKDEVVNELLAFESVASELNCQQFKLYNCVGFRTQAFDLQEFNVALSDWSEVAELVKSYSKACCAVPNVELFAHNAIAYQKAMNIWQNDDKVAIVQATGTGKSYLIAKIMATMLSCKKLIVSPSRYILDQQRKIVHWADGNTKYLTYAKLERMSDQEIKDLQPDFINLDEFHRCGAKEWGRGVERLLKYNPQAKKLGTSATPIRYLDNERDMGDELFGNNLAANLSLSEAIAKKILPAPTIVTALYTLEEEHGNLQELLQKSNLSQERKNVIQAEIDNFQNRWKKDFSISKIIQEQLGSTTIRKIIIFCSGEEHLQKMRKMIIEWFATAFDEKINIYKVSSKMTDRKNKEVLCRFRKADSGNDFHFLFAINMLNEGLHISGVGAVMLLRTTISPIIFYQQIGRCIDVNVQHKPIIFDFVGNFQSICVGDFYRDFTNAEETHNAKRKRLGLPEVIFDLQIIDETTKVVEFFEAISERLLSWNACFKVFQDHVRECGNAKVLHSHVTKDGFRLGWWVARQRTNKRKKQLSLKRIKLLEELPDWSWDPYEFNWQKKFQILQNYVQEYGHARVPQDYVTQDKIKLGLWVRMWRKKKNKLSQERVQLLESLPGWSWNPLEDSWQKNFHVLQKYVQEHGHARVPQKYINGEGVRLGMWISTQRKRRARLSQEHSELLEGLPGWSWRVL